MRAQSFGVHGGCGDKDELFGKQKRTLCSGGGRKELYLYMLIIFICLDVLVHNAYIYIYYIYNPIASKYLVRRCLGTQNPLQNYLQKGLEHKGIIITYIYIFGFIFLFGSEGTWSEQTIH